MRTLFVKIFLWFWLASILIIVSTVALVSIFEPFRPLPKDARVVKRMAHQGQRAVEILELHGPEALQNFLIHKEQRQGRHLTLFNEKIQVEAGQNVTAEERELASRSGQSGIAEFLKKDRSFLIARPIYGASGKTYYIVGEIPRRPRGFPLRRLFSPPILSLRLLAIFIVASIFCYWLARYLASPAAKLRAATQQLAAGELTTRVGDSFGGR